MGCYPHKLSTAEKATIGIFGALIVGIVIAIVAISRRWNEVKWLLYLHFNILDKSDNNEDLTDKKYDAFVSPTGITSNLQCFPQCTQIF